ncbi:hypothetical protein RHGRI_032315 [Rhododendron griersonianum]|uniref:non-specific serine/threonine protein kinase n=1 Tax=Rhododendron griersonianum TaxID=479676 RepID=A0AAV6IBX4_9ERIC|nr:hypothetical protein RHGRI_032315 [Rhododendron griersonianum]
MKASIPTKGDATKGGESSQEGIPHPHCILGSNLSHRIATIPENSKLLRPKSNFQSPPAAPPPPVSQTPPSTSPAEDYLVQLKRFSLRELQVATDNFSNRNILGRDGFGKVYKGRLADGSLVAVERLKEERTRGGELMFQKEVEMIKRSETQPPLDWPIRKRIALESARGLAYLHDQCDPKIIHRDVTAARLLLDEEFEAVVGDFGLAKLMDYKDTHVITAVRGTMGHIAPEYLSTGRCSEKTDVFGYGVMLLELITGQRSFDLARLANDGDVMLLDWVKGLLKEKKLETAVDADLQGNYIDEEVEQLIQVALLCTQDTAMERPKMSEVVRMLEGDGLAGRWEEWHKEEFFRQEFKHTHHQEFNHTHRQEFNHVRMLEGDGLAGRWEKWQKEELFRQEFNHTHRQNNDWIIADGNALPDSTPNLRPEELSSPR